MRTMVRNVSHYKREHDAGQLTHHYQQQRVETMRQS